MTHYTLISPTLYTQKRQLLAILKDTSEDSEIRIAAYLQVMTCPTSDILTQIQILVEDEAEDSQVCGKVLLFHLLLLHV